MGRSLAHMLGLFLFLMLLPVPTPEGSPARLFDGTWGRGPGHVMTEADWAAYDSCGCPVNIYAIDNRRIALDWRRHDLHFEVSREGEDWLWTPVDGGEPYLARLTADGDLRLATPGADGWISAETHARCPTPPEHDARRAAAVADPASVRRSRCRN